MALAFTATSYSTAAVATPATSVAVATQPPDNCHTIIAFNPDPVNSALIGQATAPAALTGGVNATTIPPRGYATLGIGPLSERGPITNLVCDAIGGAITVQVTYLNQFGAP